MRVLMVGLRLAVSSSVATPLAAQHFVWPRGDSLRVEAAPEWGEFHGDTLLLRYRLSNAPDSRQRLHIFQLETRARVLSLTAPGGRSEWVLVGPVEGDSVTFWGPAVAAHKISAGHTVRGLALQAAGLPGIVRYWAQGYFDPPRVPRGAEDQVPEAPPIEENSFTALTVGAEPVADRAAASLGARLSRLRDQACQLGWITSPGVCHSLEVKLEQLQASLRRSNASAAKAQLQALLDELDAQHGPEPGKHVSDNAYWLLKLNAEYLLGRI